jgi:hypothetical protein
VPKLLIVARYFAKEQADMPTSRLMLRLVAG